MNFSAIQALQRGTTAHSEGNLHDAEQCYRAFLDAPPQRPHTNQDLHALALAYNNLGFVLQLRGDLDGAIDNFRQAVRNKPDYHEASNNLGYTLQLKGELSAAIRSYRQAVKIKPDYAEACFNLGQALQEAGDLQASIACLQQVVRIRPDDAGAYNALGAAYQLNGDLTAAIDSYKQALIIDPAYAEAYNNMGGAHQVNGDLDAAIESCTTALKIKPDYANAHNNIGHALQDKGEWQAAIASYQKALNIEPDSALTYNNMGNALKAVGKYDEALKYFDVLDGPKFSKAFEFNPAKPHYWLNSQSQALECLYILGRYTELLERVHSLAESGDVNRRVAAVSAFVCHQLKTEDPYPFCRDPLDFLHISHLSHHISDVDRFTELLIQEGSKVNLVREPRHGVTKFGFQTANTVFKAGRKCDALEKILRREIASYFSRFRSEDCSFMKLWPRQYDLKGWFVRLIKHGYQRSHIHPAGWLSGIIYLKTLDAPEGDEGAIELGLHGYDLPILDENYARTVHRPQRGEILLFPSSLFHKTIPFNTDEERCVIAFDLHPVSD